MLVSIGIEMGLRSWRPWFIMAEDGIEVGTLGEVDDATFAVVLDLDAEQLVELV